MTFPHFFCVGVLFPIHINSIVNNKNYVKFSRNWSANDIRPSVARPITEIEGIFQRYYPGQGSTERYLKFRHEWRWSAEKLV